MPKPDSKTDWERVKATIDSPIPYDPEDGPYNPNDDDATERYLRESSSRYRGQQGPQKPSNE
jgi:hypothetical protein